MKESLIECPHCGEHIALQTQTTETPKKTVWPSKDNRDKIAEEMEKMAKAMNDGFKAVFNRELWR
jgi:phage terminase large subunit GpA-like protein